MIIDGVFYIPSTALLPGIDKIALKDNELFTILDGNGESPRIYRRELGFYFQDTRYLDTWELAINGDAATGLSRSHRSHANSYVFVMTNKDMNSLDYEGRIPRDRLHVRRILTLDRDQVFEQIEFTNFDNLPHHLQVERRAASRFNDIFEVRGIRRERRGTLERPALSEDRQTVTLAYQGLDGKRYETRIWSPEPVSTVKFEDIGLVLIHDVTLRPQESVTLKYVIAFDHEIRPTIGRTPVHIGQLSVEEHARRLEELPPRETLTLPTFVTDNAKINETLEVAAQDLASLVTRRGSSLYPDAGIPWFCAPFGRDGLITAYQLLPWAPSLAEGVLDVVFPMLGQKVDSFTDEEPGKVFHERRFGEMARLREIPFIPYYGSVDSTPLALILLGEYVSWTRQFAFARRWWEAANTSLDWIRGKLSDDRHGFLSYQAASPAGLRNQGWKDSHDSIMHEDGSMAEPPIALAEAQAYAYAALISMAGLARQLGHAAEYEKWTDEAAALRRRFHERFWDETRGAVVLALDGQGRPCRVLASNMGHCLWCGIVDDQQAVRIADHLMSEAMFSGHGIRTLALSEKAYNPLSYHNGSIWPHDNSLIAEGLRRYDQNHHLLRLAAGLLSVGETASDNRLPELFCGFAKMSSTGPVPYDVACKPQAWAAGAIFLVLKSLLGLQIGLGGDTLLFRAPLLPPQIHSLEIRRLPVLDFELDLLIRQGALTSTVEVLRKTGSHGRVHILE